MTKHSIADVTEVFSVAVSVRYDGLMTKHSPRTSTPLVGPSLVCKEYHLGLLIQLGSLMEVGSCTSADSITGFSPTVNWKSTPNISNGINAIS